MSADRVIELYQAACCLLAAGGVIVGLRLLGSRLSRRRDLATACRLVVYAFALRGAVAVSLSLLGSVGDTIRGPDDPAFAAGAVQLAESGVDLSWLARLDGDAITFVGALWFAALGDPGALSLRLVNAGIACAGLLVLAAAVHDLGGRRASVIATVIVCLEPSGVLFSTILQKESLMLAAGGCVALGGARLRDGDLRHGALWVAGGLALAVSSRPYAANFLALGIAIFVSVEVIRRRIVSRPVAAAGVAALIAVGVGAVLSPAGTRGLARLQEFQVLETVNGAALQLAPVDFTDPVSAAESSVRRLVEFVVLPAPWRAGNVEQLLGAFGTSLFWLLLCFAAVAGYQAARERRAILPLCLAFSVALGYAVTSANAGTGFRHRIQLILFVAAVIGVWAADRSSGAVVIDDRGPLGNRLSRSVASARSLFGRARLSTRVSAADPPPRSGTSRTP